MAKFLAEGGYSSPIGGYNRRMRRLLEEVYKDPAAFYTGDLAARITTGLKVVISCKKMFEIMKETAREEKSRCVVIKALASRRIDWRREAES